MKYGTRGTTKPPRKASGSNGKPATKTKGGKSGSRKSAATQC